MADAERAPSYSEAHRQASVSAPGLASDDDAAVLGTYREHWLTQYLRARSGWFG